MLQKTRDVSVNRKKTDDFIFHSGEWGWSNTKKCSAEEIKIVHSGTNQRNLLQASVIKFIQTFYPRIKFLQKEMSNFHPLPPPLPVNYRVHRFRREDGQVTQS